MLPVPFSHPCDTCKGGPSSHDLNMILMPLRKSLLKGGTQILYASCQGQYFEEAKKKLCLDCWRCGGEEHMCGERAIFKLRPTHLPGYASRSGPIRVTLACFAYKYKEAIGTALHCSASLYYPPPPMQTAVKQYSIATF
jgi:hypothetical protein